MIFQFRDFNWNGERFSIFFEFMYLHVEPAAKNNNLHRLSYEQAGGRRYV